MSHLPATAPGWTRVCLTHANGVARSWACPGNIVLRAAALLVSLALAMSFLTSAAHALDEVVLNNGRRYMGTIISSTPESIVLSIEGGSVEFPRSAVTSPPYFGPAATAPEAAEQAAPDFDPRQHPIPPLNFALRRLREFSWASSPRQVPMIVSDRGRWRYVPGVSFWVGGFCQVSCYGDPARPAAIEVSLHNPQREAWDQKRDLLEYMMGLVPGLATDNRFDSLNIRGDSFAVGDLWFSVSAPESAENPGRWTIRLIHETSIAASRASIQELQAISESVAETLIDPSKPRSWQRGSWTLEELGWLRRTPLVSPSETETGGTAGAEAPASDPAAWSSLGGERVFVRSYTRERGTYARSTNDWLREFASNTAGP